MTRNRIAVLALVIVLGAVIGIAFVRSTSGPASKATPILDQQFASWKRSHPGYTCSPLDRSSKTVASTLCTTATDTQIRVQIVSVSLLAIAETQPLIGGSVDWGQILWYLIPSVTLGLLVVISLLLARHFRPAAHNRRSAPQ